MVALSTAFYARLSIGSRQIVEIFNILNEFMGNIFGEVPAYTTIGYWAQELGLSVYKESCTLFKGKRYALIVDESMMIGSEKMLLTLAVAADNIGMAITEKNITIVDISIAKSWNGKSIQGVLEKVADKIGHKPEYVISDNGSVYVRPLEMLVINITMILVILLACSSKEFTRMILIFRSFQVMFR